MKNEQVYTKFHR